MESKMIITDNDRVFDALDRLRAKERKGMTRSEWLAEEATCAADARASVEPAAVSALTKLANRCRRQAKKAKKS
jgi:hypothetical protein